MDACWQYAPAVGVGSRVEFALEVDCEEQGCDPRHFDDGLIVAIPLDAASGDEFNEMQLARDTVNGHAAKQVQRTVTLSEWKPR